MSNFKRFGFKSFGPPPIFGPSMLKEMNHLIFLWAISDEKNGITGYNLQKIFDADTDENEDKPNQPNTTIYRTLKHLEKNNFLEIEQKIVNGRAQKVYRITPLGLEKLKKLKENWTNIISFLVPPEGLSFPFMRHVRHPHFLHHLNEIETKQDAVDFFVNIKNMLENMENKMESRLEHIKNAKNILADSISTLENSNNFNPNDFKGVVLEIFGKLKRRF